MAVKTCSKAISTYSLGHGKSTCFFQATFLWLFGPDYPLLILPCVNGAENLSMHFDMEETENPIQNQKKKRTQSDKIGRLKYNQQLLKQTLAEVEEVS